jgi:hypothetical protein
MSAKVTITWSVPSGYLPGDYAQLYGNGGNGSIDYDTPLSNDRYELFPAGGGIYGWYHQSWYQFSWYHGYSMRCPGWGHQSWYHFPWYYGSNVITVQYDVSGCGDYKFALRIFDRAGNPNEGSPQELEAAIHIAPPAPSGLKGKSYDKDTDILILEAA